MKANRRDCPLNLPVLRLYLYRRGYLPLSFSPQTTRADRQTLRQKRHHPPLGAIKKKDKFQERSRSPPGPLLGAQERPGRAPSAPLAAPRPPQEPPEARRELKRPQLTKPYVFQGFSPSPASWKPSERSARPTLLSPARSSASSSHLSRFQLHRPPTSPPKSSKKAPPRAAPCRGGTGRPISPESLSLRRRRPLGPKDRPKSASRPPKSAF